MLLFGEFLFNHVLRGNTAVIGAGHPIGVFAKHTVGTDEHVLQGVGGRMAHVERARNVGRRYNNNKRFFGFIVFGGKQFGSLPFVGQFLFYFLRFIRFG